VRKASAFAAAVLVVLLGLALFGAGPAGAVWNPGPPPGGPKAGATSDMIMSGTGAGGAVDGFIGPAGSVSDPSVPYPAAPPAGFTSHPEGFAGVIFGTSTVGGATLSLYCINILTVTYGGIGYNLGTWDASNVHNVGYVAYLLNHYYPKVPGAPALGSANEQAAAVQAAIWYFSDNYVLSTTDPLRAAVAGIVEDARTNGPQAAPTPPSLSLSPATASGPVGGLVGPFTVTSPSAPAAVVAVGASMFSDAAGTAAVANGTTVPNGTQLWLQGAAPGSATLTATAVATVPSGNVYLYSGNFANVTDAQRLILAQSAEVTTTVSAALQLFDTASLVVSKSIAGPGAGVQDAITITVSCNGTALPDFVIPAGATGSQTKTYAGIPTPSTCTITETANGANGSVSVVTVGAPQTVTLPADESPNDVVDAQPITDTYDLLPTTTSNGSTTTTTTGGSTTSSTEGPSVAPTSTPNETLPPTGGPERSAFWAALAALVAGGALLLVARRRNAGEADRP
jgi:hypothetical protein